MHISENGLHLIEGFEGFSSAPYWDRYGGVWTRGYGETEGIGPNSRHITQAYGESNLRFRLERFYEYAIRDLGVALNQNQWDALCSFIWNLGPGVLARGTSLARHLQVHQWEAAANEMLLYDHAGGVVLEGLRRRRETERKLFLTPVGGAPHSILTGYEAVAVRAYDRANAHKSLRNLGERRRLRKLLIQYRQAIWWAAVKGVIVLHKPHQKTQPGWKINHRGERYNILWSRTK